MSVNKWYRPVLYSMAAVLLFLAMLDVARSDYFAAIAPAVAAGLTLWQPSLQRTAYRLGWTAGRFDLIVNVERETLNGTATTAEAFVDQLTVDSLNWEDIGKGVY